MTPKDLEEYRAEFLAVSDSLAATTQCLSDDLTVAGRSDLAGAVMLAGAAIVEQLEVLRILLTIEGAR